jgi:hypothetical protein
MNNNNVATYSLQIRRYGRLQWSRWLTVAINHRSIVRGLEEKLLRLALLPRQRPCQISRRSAHTLGETCWTHARSD